MVKHGIDIIIGTTNFLNPGQVSIQACDCPIFAQAKLIQWRWTDYYSLGKLIIMFGGLHIEKALWNIARPRYVHQVTALTLSALQHIAYDGISSTLSFEVLRNELKNSSPTFRFWDLILRSVLVIIRAHREKNLQLYIEALDKIMFLFFALDHYNYCRWLSAHIQDLQTLTDKVRCVLEQCCVIEKTENRFSAIPLDQNHEQENAIVKGGDGIIGLTENPSA